MTTNTKLTEDDKIETVKQRIINLSLSLTALIQDINNCEPVLESLNELNREGRKKISLLKKFIEEEAEIANEQTKINKKLEILTDVKNKEEQLTTIVSAFQKSIVDCLLKIDKSNRNELLGEEDIVRHRKKKDKENLVKESSTVTDQLLSLSRNLSDITQRSGDTLGTLANSSTGIQNTRDELSNTGSVIAQSGKLLAKYGRREKTDKVLVLFAFAFFLACCFYVIQKRLF